EVLAREEGKATDRPHAAGTPAVTIFRADGLCGILDHFQIVSLCKLKNWSHIGALSIEVDRNDHFGFRRDCFANLRWIDIVRPGFNIHKNWLGTKPGDSARSCKE